MKYARRVCFLWLLAGIASSPVYAQEAKSAPAKPSPASSSSEDDEFLEFLGSVDSDATDDDWMDYLAQTDILKVAKAKKKAPAPTQSRATQDKADK